MRSEDGKLSTRFTHVEDAGSPNTSTGGVVVGMKVGFEEVDEEERK